MGSTALLLAVYVVTVTAAAFLIPHEWDWKALQWVNARGAPTFSQDVRIVDVLWNSDPAAIPSNRQRVAAFLGALVASDQRPAAVILDIEFKPCQDNPCSDSRWLSAVVTLAASIRRAVTAFPVYATEEFAFNRQDGEPTGPLNPHDAQIYGALSGAADTVFVSVPNENGAYYRPCTAGVPVASPSGVVEGTEDVWSMVSRVTTQSLAGTPTCNTMPLPVRVGAAPPIYRFSTARAFPDYAELDKTYVIVGTTEYDHSVYTNESGPELLGWALSAKLNQDAQLDVQPQQGLLVLLVPVFSALAVIAYFAAFFQLKRERLRRLRASLPWLASAVGAGVGLGAFALFEMWMFLSRHIQPQLSLVSFGVVLAAGLSGVRGAQILADEGAGIETPPPDTYDYDVFISYAHEDGAWVAEHVYPAFRDATLPNGKKLSVFFDTTSIRGGRDWQARISFAIDASRFVVPVYSDTYFTKPYCRFEIMRAHRKWINAGEDAHNVLPVMRGHPKIYGPVDDIQALSIDDHPNVVQEYLTEIVQRLSAQSAPAQQQENPS